MEGFRTSAYGLLPYAGELNSVGDPSSLVKKPFAFIMGATSEIEMFIYMKNLMCGKMNNDNQNK